MPIRNELAQLAEATVSAVAAIAFRGRAQMPSLRGSHAALEYAAALAREDSSARAA